jgi:hypothetical protein
MARLRYLTRRAKFFGTATFLLHWVPDNRVPCLSAHQEADGSFKKEQVPAFKLHTEAKRSRKDGRYHSSKSTFREEGGTGSIKVSRLLPIEPQSEL